MVLVIVVAVLALCAGLVANRFLRPKLMSDDDAGMAVKDLLGPLLTLTVLLLAFVLVTASGSFGKAEVAARGEARALDQLTEIAEYSTPAERERVQADAVCYARAVRTQEWPAMAKDGSGSPAPSVWSTDVRRSFRALEGKPVFGMLIAADNKRSDEREERLTQATPSIPGAIFWFLLATLTITVIALAVCLPRRNNRGQIIVLAVITALLTTTLCIIRDVDRPFGGAISVDPTAITEVERQATRDFLANHQPTDLPCDTNGNRRNT